MYLSTVQRAGRYLYREQPTAYRHVGRVQIAASQKMVALAPATSIEGLEPVGEAPVLRLDDTGKQGHLQGDQ